MLAFQALPQVSNRATYQDDIEFIEDETGEALDISSATEIVVRIADAGRDSRSLLSATLTGGTVVRPGDMGIARFTFTAAQMSTLCGGSYAFDALITINGATAQVILGQLPVLKGIPA